MARHPHRSSRPANDAWWVSGYLTSIVLAVGFVVVGVPWLLRASGSWPAGMGLLFLTAPLVGTLTGYLQDGSRRRTGVGGFLRAYLADLIDLGRQVLVVLAILPWIAMRLALVIGAILLIALAAMLLLGSVQQLTGLHIDGISDFSGDDLVDVALWFAGVVAGMSVAWALMLGLERLAPTAVALMTRTQDSIQRRLRAPGR